MKSAATLRTEIRIKQCDMAIAKQIYDREKKELAELKKQLKPLLHLANATSKQLLALKKNASSYKRYELFKKVCQANGIRGYGIYRDRIVSNDHLSVKIAFKVPPNVRKQLRQLADRVSNNGGYDSWGHRTKTERYIFAIPRNR